MAKITAETKVRLSSGKMATFKLEDGKVSIRLPIAFSTPTFDLADLRVALVDLEAAQAAGQTVAGDEAGS